VTEAEERQFAIRLLQTFADFLCSPSWAEYYEETGLYSAGMHTRVEWRRKVLHVIEVLQSEESKGIPLQKILEELLPSFSPDDF
jgi:hypothetical protein